MIRCALLSLIFLTAFPVFAETDASLSAEEVVAATMPSIVAIRAKTDSGESSGTGFIVDSDGAIVTNLHVIEGATQLEVKLHSGEQHARVKVASFDEQRDLAIIRIPGFGLPAISFGNSEEAKVGETVYAIGNPFGLEDSVTKGIVSSIRVGDDGVKIIQTDTAVSQGNSGGPLIDQNGSAIGVITFKVRGGENLNFAMPINYVRALLGFETLMSLEEFAQELGKQNVSLFSEDSDSKTLSGSWLSLTSNTTRVLKQDGDFLYGVYSDEGSNYSYDMKLQSDETYKGVTRGTWRGTYPSAWDGSEVEVTCSEEVEIEILIVGRNRLEGRTKFAPWPEKARDQKKYVKSCGKGFEQVWEDFVWVRLD